MMDLTQHGFGGSLSGDSFSCLGGDLSTEIFHEKQKSMQVFTVHDLVQTSIKLTHGLLYLTSMQSFGKHYG